MSIVSRSLVNLDVIVVCLVYHLIVSQCMILENITVLVQIYCGVLMSIVILVGLLSDSLV